MAVGLQKVNMLQRSIPAALPQDQRVEKVAHHSSHVIRLRIARLGLHKYRLSSRILLAFSRWERMTYFDGREVLFDVLNDEMKHRRYLFCI